MCKYFEEGKVCKYNENCSYAHGDHEIRNQMDNARSFMNQQQPSSSQFDPMKLPHIATRIRWHQMAILCEKLEELYQADPNKMERVRSAKQLLALEQKIDEASPILQRLVFDFEADEKEKKKLKDIFKDAVKFAEKNIEDLQNSRQVPEVLKHEPKYIKAMSKSL